MLLREFTASDRNGRLLCAGFKSQESNKYAQRGTSIHSGLEAYYEQYLDDKKEDVKPISYRSLLSKQLLEERFGEFEILDVESKVFFNHKSIRSHKKDQNTLALKVDDQTVLSGNIDLLIKTKEHGVLIVDWKSGFHPENYDSTQLKTYTALLYDYFQNDFASSFNPKIKRSIEKYGIGACYAFIDLEFIKGPFSWTCKELEQETLEIKKQVNNASDPDFNSGEKQCKYCVHQSLCPALKISSLNQYKNLGLEEQWEYVKRMKLSNKSNASLAKEIEENIISKLQEGVEVKNTKLKPVKRYHYKQESLFQQLDDLGLAKDQIYVKDKLVSNTEIDGVLKLAGMTKDEIKSLKEEKITSYSLKDVA